MITINAEDFANLEPEQKRQYRAAANFFKLAKATTDLFKKRELLIQGRGHLTEVGDTRRIELVDTEIASVSEALTATLAPES